METAIETKLVKRFLEGDESAFSVIVSNFKQKIYWHARRMLGNHADADDVTQETLITIYKKLNTFRFDSSLNTWVYQITSRKCLNYLKKKKLKSFFLPESEEARSLKRNEDVAAAFESREKLARLDEILERLPPKQREIFVLRNFEELSYREIEEITGTSIGALKASYFHALKKVKELMPDE
ncbi:MAG: RNA polymerase sigma factor [Chlorobi bacterium]|nr:RNA polymerase sigma factor [Chlorobiota bacterium]